MAAHSSILAWRISGMAEPGGLPSKGVAQSWTQLKRLSSSSTGIAIQFHFSWNYNSPIFFRSTSKYISFYQLAIHPSSQQVKAFTTSLLPRAGARQAPRDVVLIACWLIGNSLPKSLFTLCFLKQHLVPTLARQAPQLTTLIRRLANRTNLIWECLRINLDRGREGSKIRQQESLNGRH